MDFFVFSVEGRRGKAVRSQDIVFGLKNKQSVAVFFAPQPRAIPIVLTTRALRILPRVASLNSFLVFELKIH